MFLFLFLNFLSSDLGKYNDGNKNPTLYIIIFINVFEIVPKYTNAGPLLRCFSHHNETKTPTTHIKHNTHLLHITHSHHNKYTFL